METDEKHHLLWNLNGHLIRRELRVEISSLNNETTSNNSQSPWEIQHQKALHSSFSLPLKAIWNSPNSKEKTGRKNRSFTRSGNSRLNECITKTANLSLIAFIQTAVLTSFHDRRCTVTTHSQPLDSHRIIRQSTSTCQPHQTKPLPSVARLATV